MSAKIIDGKTIAQKIKNQVKKEIQALPYAPGLAVFLVGDDEASHLYVRLKEKACHEVGIDFHKYYCEDQTCQTDIFEALEFINKDSHINAILIQLPLPEKFDEQQVIDKMTPEKDVDGFHPKTLKKFLDGKDDFIPGLSLGILRLVESTDEKLAGKTAVIVANSDIFSRPLVKLFEDADMKTIVVSPDDKDLAEQTLRGDVLVVAIGRAHFIKGEMVKEGAIVIDVGTNKVEGELVGDVDFDEAQKRAGHITPVPGGVGPVTVAMLLENTVRLAKRQQ